MAGRTLTRRQALAAGAGALLGGAAARFRLAPAALAVRARGAAPLRLLPPSADVWALSLAVHGTPADARLTAAGSPVETRRAGLRTTSTGTTCRIWTMPTSRCVA